MNSGDYAKDVDIMIGIQFLDKKEYFCMIKTSSFDF